MKELRDLLQSLGWSAELVRAFTVLPREDSERLPTHPELDAGSEELPNVELSLVEYGSENAGGIKTRTAEPVYRTVYPHEGDGSHVPNDSIILYRQISHVSLTIL